MGMTYPVCPCGCGKTEQDLNFHGLNATLFCIACGRPVIDNGGQWYSHFDGTDAGLNCDKSPAVD